MFEIALAKLITSSNILATILQVNLLQFTSVFSVQLSPNGTFGDKWQSFLMDEMPLSPLNQQR